MKSRSLTHRLIAGVLLAEFLCAALFSAVAITHEMHGRRRAFDVMLRGRADSLMGAVQDAEDPEDRGELMPLIASLLRYRVIRVQFTHYPPPRYRPSVPFGFPLYTQPNKNGAHGK